MADRIACRLMQRSWTNGELLNLLTAKVTRYGLHDLEQMHPRFEQKVQHLPDG